MEATNLGFRGKGLGLLEVQVQGLGTRAAEFSGFGCNMSRVAFWELGERHLY